MIQLRIVECGMRNKKVTGYGLHVADYRIKKLIKLGTFNSELDTCNSQRATGYWMLDKKIAEC
jgi:hypothetical protein